jgi:hypothetical protein
MKMKMNEWYRYEIRSIDAIAEGGDFDDGTSKPTWTWNDSYRVCEGRINSKTLSNRTVAAAFRRNGIVMKKGTTYIDDALCGDIFELRHRATDMPLYALLIDDEPITVQKALPPIPARNQRCIMCGTNFHYHEITDYCSRRCEIAAGFGTHQRGTESLLESL